MMERGDHVTFYHGTEMLRHAFWLVLSFIQGRHYTIAADEETAQRIRISDHEAIISKLQDQESES